MEEEESSMSSTTGGGAGGAVVGALERSFAEVQGILEQNRVLIQEIGQNHEARDADGLSRNVSLIRELNTNVARVVDLYAHLSCSFSRSLLAPSPSAPPPRAHKRSRPQ